MINIYKNIATDILSCILDWYFLQSINFKVNIKLQNNCRIFENADDSFNYNKK